MLLSVGGGFYLLVRLLVVWSTFAAAVIVVDRWTGRWTTKMGPCLATERRKVFDNDKKTERSQSAKGEFPSFVLAKLLRSSSDSSVATDTRH